MKNFLKGSAIAVSALPTLALAQASAFTVLDTIGVFIDRATPILVSFAVLYFIFGVIRFVIAGDADKKAEARQTVIQGIIGLFVIVSLWGIVFFIGNTFGVGPTGEVNNIIPTVGNN
jgi:hypothetical membrane protein